MSVIQIHGQRDPLVPYEGQVEDGVVFELSAQNTIALWAAHNGCSPNPEADTSQPGITIYRHEDCDNSREVLLYAVHEGGHNPELSRDGRFFLDPPGELFALIWEFFERNAQTR